jgi:hypothetical protein
MSCINITPLVLSDTFNTWFERSNQSIEALNSFTIRGLSASTTDGVRGLKFVDAGSCYYSLALETGPFVGFVTGEDTGIYGTGDATNPYKLTLVATGPTMSAEAVTGDDYALVSDTSDGGLFKLAPVSSFVTNIVGGNNISVTLTNGTYTISYVELTFSPTMTINGITTNSSSSSYEIKEGGLINNGTITFTIGNGGDVDHDGGDITLLNADRVTGFDAISFNSNTEEGTDDGVSLPANVNTWFTPTTRTISFRAEFSPQSTSDGIPYSGSNVFVTRIIYFGWRFGGFDSTTQYNSAGSIPTDSLTDLIYEGQATWNATGASTRIFGDPTVARFFSISIQSNSSYIYFVHTDKNASGGYGWAPTLLQENGSPVNDGLVDIGIATISGNTYRVWRSGETYNAGTKTFGIK